MAKVKTQENYMDYVPKHNQLFPFQKNKKNHIEIKIKNKGIIKKVTQVLLKKPKYTYIELEDMGSFIWEQIDGERTVYDIGLLVKERFGKEAEPLFERLIEYLHILRRNNFIVYVNKIKK